MELLKAIAELINNDEKLGIDPKIETTNTNERFLKLEIFQALNLIN